MLNNSNNINKINNHILHQLIEHKNTTYDVGNSGTGLGNPQKIVTGKNCS